MKLYENLRSKVAHVTKMATKPINGEYILKHSSSEEGSWCQWNAVYSIGKNPWKLLIRYLSIGHSSTTKFVPRFIMTTGWSFKFKPFNGKVKCSPLGGNMVKSLDIMHTRTRVQGCSCEWCDQDGHQAKEWRGPNRNWLKITYNSK